MGISFDTNAAGARVLDSINISVQKKASQLEAQSALKLIDSATQAQSSRPVTAPHVGNNVNIKV